MMLDLFEPQQVTELGLLHEKVLAVALIRLGDQRHSLDLFEPERLDPDPFCGIVGQQAHLLDAKVHEVVQMFHDTQETRITDIPYIGKRYLQAAPNEEVTADQMRGLPAPVAEIRNVRLDTPSFRE